MDSSRNVTVHPAAPLRGSLGVPGDKSISHRAALLAAMTPGISAINGFLRSEDCLRTLAALQSLGLDVREDQGRIAITGGMRSWRRPAAPLDLANSGTALRLLAGILAGCPFDTVLTGDASLRSRPLRRIAEPLAAMGARIEFLERDGEAPMRIRGGALRGIRFRSPVASAQVKSCVLLAGILAEGRTSVAEPAPSRDHTERMLAAAGIPVRRRDGEVEVTGSAGGQPALKPMSWTVPGDFSAAAFWIAAAAGRPGSDLEIESVGLNPGRTALLTVLRRMGADIRVTPVAGDAAEPTGRIRVAGRRLTGTTVAGPEIPALIDELPLVAVAGALAAGETAIHDAAELRVKESDRIAVMAAALRAFGAAVSERPDGLTVRAPARLRGGATVATARDHRVAMCAAVLATCADAPVTILDAGSAATSYPGFWDQLRELGVHAE